MKIFTIQTFWALNWAKIESQRFLENVYRIQDMSVTVMFYSFLNMVENFHHYWRAYGGWSFAMSPYYNEGITKSLDDPTNIEAQKIFDPYFYRDRLTMPKVVSFP